MVIKRYNVNIREKVNKIDNIISAVYREFISVYNNKGLFILYNIKNKKMDLIKNIGRLGYTVNFVYIFQLRKW